MHRRTFLKNSTLLASSFLFPSFAMGGDIDLSGVNFSQSLYEENDAQTIVYFLYGGASELGANLTNIDEINKKSSNDYYDYFGTITPTANHFWKEAGGDILERMLAKKDVNIFRTCYSDIREKSDNRSHGGCVEQNQLGKPEYNSAGVFSIISKILTQNGVVTPQSKLPFITFESNPKFFSNIDITLPSYARPFALSSSLINPYDDNNGDWYYRTHEEHGNDAYPSIIGEMNALSLKNNPEGELAENFKQRELLKDFIKSIKEDPLPDGVVYPNNSTAESIKNAISIMVKNPDTKVITAGSKGFGVWDEHGNSLFYLDRMKELLESIEIGMQHIKSANREGKINIIVFGDFGRGVNLNDAKGWDHGNNQNVFMFGGKNHFNHVGVVGETYVHDYGRVNRQYTRPKEGSYWFEPFSIAATLYKLYGITNPEVLTGGYGAIGAGLLKN